MGYASAIGMAFALAGCGLILETDPPDPRSTGGMDGGVRPRADGGGQDGDLIPDDGAILDGREEVDAEKPPPEPDGCGGPSFIQDDFEDREPPAWGMTTVAGGGTITEEGGKLHLDLPAGTPEPSAAYLSTRWFDAREDGTAVQVVVRDGAATEAEVALALVHAERTYASIFVSGGTIQFVIVEDGAMIVSGSGTPYDPTTHRWWGIGGLSGRIYFATSPDGMVWTSMASIPAPAFLEAVQVGVGALSRARLAVPLSAEMDDLGLAPRTPRELPCASDSYSDTFDGPLYPYRWLPRGEATCTLAHDGDTGSLAIGATDGECGIFSRHDYDAREHAVTLEIARGPVSSEYIFQLLLLGAGGEGRAEFTCSGTAGLLMESGASVSTASFVCGGARFYRLRHGAGAWHLETAAVDSFDEVATVPASWDPDQVAVLITANAPRLTMVDDPVYLSTYNP